MTIQAQTPDGVTHEFPDGTPDNVIDGAIKSYLAPKSQYWNDVNSDVANEAVEDIGRIGQGNATPLTAMATATAYPRAMASEGAKSVMGNYVEPAAQKIANAIDNPATENAAANMGKTYDYVNDAVHAGAQKVADTIDNPLTESITNTAASTLGDSGKILSVAAPLEGAIGKTGEAMDALEGLSNKFAEKYPENNPFEPIKPKTGINPDKYVNPDTQDIFDNAGISRNDLSAMTPKQIQDEKNQLYVAGIASNIQKSQAVKSGIYSMADEVGNSQTFDASNTKNILDALHAQYAADPAYNGSPLVRKLNSWKAMFDDDGAITPTRLNNLQDQVDDAYRESPKSPEGTIYQSIKNPVDTAVSAAKTQFPNWGKLIDTADDAHYNLIKLTNEDSTFTNKWSPDSQKDFGITMNKTGRIGDLAGDTKRQMGNITNIQDEAQLQQVMSTIPQELQGQFLQDVASNSSSPSSIKNLAKGIYYGAKGNYSQALSNIIKSAPSASEIKEWDPDAATHITDRTQQWKDTANEAYQNHIDEQVAKNGASASDARQAATEMQRQEYDASMRSNLGNTQIPKDINAPMTSQLSPSERMAAWSNVADRTTKTNNAISKQTAAKAALQNIADKAPPGPIKDMADIAPPTLSESLQRETAQTGPYNNDEYHAMLDRGYTAAQLKAMGYARGGHVTPTEAQKKAGNYKKHHVNFQGLNISIENPKGTERSGKSADGKEWSVEMPDHYGYIKQTMGADGDHVDTYLGPNPKSKRVYIIDQGNLHNGKFDEHKVMLGFLDKNSAIASYKKAFSDGKGAARIQKVTRMTMDEFKNWLKESDTTKPAAKAA